MGSPTRRGFLAPGVLEDVPRCSGASTQSAPIAARFPIFRVVEWHARDTAAHGVAVPSMFDGLPTATTSIEAVLRPRVGGHALPQRSAPANVLLHADQLWLIDFEYAGMNEAAFDLANLSVNCGFDAATDERLLRASSGGASTRASVGPAPIHEGHERAARGHVGRRPAGHQHAESVDFVDYATNGSATRRAVRRSVLCRRPGAGDAHGAMV